ncbi:MAG: TolC family protein [Bacteroidetes bacterium]|nr:TolC family protein [Bacteroidota bacterium]
MIPLKKYTLLLAIAVTAFHTQAQEADKTNFSLQEAIEYAMKNSPNYQTSELDYKSADYRRKEIAGMGLPQINGSIDFKDYLEFPTQIIPMSAFVPTAPSDAYMGVKFGIQYNATAGISAQQLLFSADYLFGLKASKEYLNLARVNKNRSKDELVAQVTKAYYGVLVNQSRLKLLDANVEKLSKTLDELKAMNQQGFVELIDVQRLEVSQNNLVTEKEKVTQFLSLGENLLKFQMGYKISLPISLTDNLNYSDDLSTEQPVSEIDITKRADYQLLTAQQSLYNIDVKRLKWGYMPTLAAFGSLQYNSMRPNLNFFETDKNNAVKQWYPAFIVGVQLNVNIFDGLQRHYKIQQSKITALKNEQTLKNLELGAQMEASTAAISYNNALKTFAVNKRNIDLAQQVFDVSQKKYAQGVGSNLEVVNAQASLREAETNYYNALYEMLIYKTDYLKATGALGK